MMFAENNQCLLTNQCELSGHCLCFKQTMVCTKWKQRQRLLVVSSLLLIAAATMIPENSSEALKQSTSGLIMVSMF